MNKNSHKLEDNLYVPKVYGVFSVDENDEIFSSNKKKTFSGIWQSFSHIFTPFLDNIFSLICRNYIFSHVKPFSHLREHKIK